MSIQVSITLLIVDAIPSLLDPSNVRELGLAFLHAFCLLDEVVARSVPLWCLARPEYPCYAVWVIIHLEQSHYKLEGGWEQ